MQLKKNGDGIVIPAYMNEEFFVRVLEDGLCEVKIVLLDVTFEWGSNPGDNYCSQIYRVTLNFQRHTTDSESVETETLSLIVKTIPVIPETQFLEDVGVFIKEKLIYTDVLPRMEILLENGEKFGAKCFYAVKSPLKTIIFNDLGTDGYRLASRQDCLDFEHCKVLLTKLGKFHGTSMVLKQRDPSILKRLRSGMLCEETVVMSDTYERMFGGNLLYLAELAATWPGFEKIAEKLKLYHTNFKTVAPKSSALEENDRFTVINHGDLWTSNFMYNYEDAENPKKPTNVLFIDYQLCIEASPACDLNFFLHTSVQLDVLKKHRDDLIAIYYESLVKTLEFARYDNIPTMDDLQYELRNRELYGLFGLYGFLPMVTMSKELSQDSSIESLSDSAAALKKIQKIFSQEKLQAFLKYGLKRYEELGVLDDIAKYV